MDQEIVDYILQAQKHGLPDVEIKQNLLNAGWDAAMVEESFVFAKAADSRLAGGPASSPPFQKPGPQHQPPASQNSYTTITVSEQSFQKAPAQSRPFFKSKLFWSVLILLAVLGGSAYGYFKYFSVTPQNILAKAMSVKWPAVYQSDYSLSYSYADASSTKPITLTFSGSAYLDGRNASSTESSNSFTVGLNSPTGNESANLQYLFINNVLYLDVSKISQLSSLGSNWLKLDVAEFQKYLAQHSSTTPQSLQNSFSNPKFKQQLSDVISKSKILTLSNFLGKENINNIPTYHLKFNLDSQVLASTTISAINLVQAQPDYTGQKITSDQENLIADTLKKFVLKEGDIWIGQKDNQVYQLNFSLAVPSAQDISNDNFADSMPGVGGSLAENRNGLRLDDARTIQQGLELYYNDHGGYPDGVSGVAQGLSPAYVLAWPSAPVPADGTCTDYFNSYWYQGTGKAFVKNGLKLYPSFNLTFCLGDATGGYAAGIGMVTPQGIAANVACPATADLCVSKNSAASVLNTEQEINGLQFNSTLVFNDTFSNFGKVQNLEAPKNSLDVMQMIQSYTSSMFRSSSTPQTLTQ